MCHAESLLHVPSSYKRRATFYVGLLDHNIIPIVCLREGYKWHADLRFLASQLVTKINRLFRPDATDFKKLLAIKLRIL